VDEGVDVDAIIERIREVAKARAHERGVGGSGEYDTNSACVAFSPFRIIPRTNIRGPNPFRRSRPALAHSEQI
jgi:hypothetical protein